MKKKEPKEIPQMTDDELMEEYRTSIRGDWTMMRLGFVAGELFTRGVEIIEDEEGRVEFVKKSA